MTILKRRPVNETEKLPYDMEEEESVCGSFLIDGKRIDEVVARLKPSGFHAVPDSLPSGL